MTERTVRLPGGADREGTTAGTVTAPDTSTAPVTDPPMPDESGVSHENVNTAGLQRTLPVGSPDPQSADGDYAGVDPDHAGALIGRILAGRYEVQRVLGRGGMGIVYEGRHIAVGRRVAIKVLRRDLARTTQAVARFHREAKAAAAIGSEHIVEVFDFGYSDEGDAFIVMELLEGSNLGQLVRAEGRLPEPRAVGIARQIARALGEAHSKGIIHRDLKSENVFILSRDGGDFVKLLDFGISKVTETGDGAPMTTEGVVMGTPYYMAPEQAMSDVETDQRIDVYALGCILYEMLTGRVPFRGRNAVEVVFKHVHEAPVPPSIACPEAQISPALDAVVLRALAKNRNERYPSATAVLTALPRSGLANSLTSLPPDTQHAPSVTSAQDADTRALRSRRPGTLDERAPERSREDRYQVAWVLGAAVITLSAMLGIVRWVRTSDPHRATHERENAATHADAGEARGRTAESARDAGAAGVAAVQSDSAVSGASAEALDASAATRAANGGGTRVGVGAAMRATRDDAGGVSGATGASAATHGDGGSASSGTGDPTMEGMHSSPYGAGGH